jgi:DNA-binding transcriptional MocR family regulator
VTVGTVTRAYAEAARRGLVGGEVGRGTYVRESGTLPTNFHHGAAIDAQRDQGDIIADLRLNFVAPIAGDANLNRILAQLATERLDAFLEYQPPQGMPEHRAAGAAWLKRAGLEVDPARVLVTAGAQHGMAVALAALLQPGDLLLTEALTFPGVRSVARLLHLRLQGLAMDQEGLLPDAFESACRQGSAKALYCMPSIQNPTGSVMSAGRRQAVAAIAERYGIAVIEDDVYGFLDEAAPPPLASFAPTQGHYVTNLSKSIAPGLRLGYLAVPTGRLEPFRAATQATLWMATPLMAEIAARWIKDGTAIWYVEERRREARARQLLARRMLGNRDLRAHPSALHGWLRLPEPWRAEDFAAAAVERGVPVTPISAFAVARTREQAVRLALGAPRDQAQLARALGVVAELAAAEPQPYLAVV